MSRLPAYAVNSVDSAFKIVELLRTRKMVRLSVVCAELGMAPSTAHRLLTTLQHHGFARQDPNTKIYVAGPALIPPQTPRIGAALRAISDPILQTLSDATGQTASLAVQCGENVLILSGLDSVGPIRPAPWVGITLPVGCSASGRAIMASMSDSEIEAQFGRAALDGLTEAFDEGIEEAMAELQDARKLGYATSIGDLDPGLAAVAVAVPLWGQIRGTLATTAPPGRLSEKRLPEVVDQLKRGAQAITKAQTGQAREEAAGLIRAIESFASLGSEQVIAHPPGDAAESRASIPLR